MDRDTAGCALALLTFFKRESLKLDNKTLFRKASTQTTSKPYKTMFNVSNTIYINLFKFNGTLLHVVHSYITDLTVLHCKKMRHIFFQATHQQNWTGSPASRMLLTWNKFAKMETNVQLRVEMQTEFCISKCSDLCAVYNDCKICITH